MGPSAPPAPEPIEFLRNSNDSGGIPHPENAQKSQKICGISWISNIFKKVSGNDGNSRFPVNFAFWSGGALQNH